VTATWRDWLELTKPRIVAAGTVAALAGFLAANPHVDGAALAFSLAGIAGITAAAGILNQVMERDVDARMPRTMNRPIPAGRVAPGTATTLGIVLAVASLLLLSTKSRPLTAALALFAFASYLGVYTPLKRVTTLNTFVGAIPGALPPVLGWTAARGELGAGAFALFAILFLWQLPHFLSIAWMYREDYRRAGMKLLTVNDPDGRSTARQALLYALALLPVSLMPSAIGITGRAHLAGAIVFGLVFLFAAARFAREQSQTNAKRLLLTSVFYLPALFSVAVADHFLSR
jgi:protoheme IX farnesyltransferase